MEFVQTPILGAYIVKNAMFPFSLELLNPPISEPKIHKHVGLFPGEQTIS